MKVLATGALGAATSSAWVESLTAFAHQQAHAHTAPAAMIAQEWTPRILSAQQNEAVIALTELIIPQTDTPGAKAAHVNRFIDGVLHDAPAAEREAFLRGLAATDERSRALYKKNFVAATPAQQTALLTEISKKETDFFRAIKSMTIDGYYTTEIGLRQELGDNGQLFLVQFAGCDHPEHG
jgi:hypothetical protein